ncbi:hypothetical protein ACIQWZ_28225 [Streptomyces sp. NPDC098077]|uniref:hypothetical protein n=1 Tax=Streptomyces sp. NPDC098077 TaxID=3366093 RepID=UPI0037F3C7B4
MTISFEKSAAVPTSAAVAELERQIGSLQAQVSNLRSTVEEQKDEARHAREKYGKLRYDAAELLHELIEDHDLGDYRQEISDKGEAIGLDALEYSYQGTVTVTFNIEGLRKDDGSKFTVREVRDYFEAQLEVNGEFEYSSYDVDPVKVELDLE